MSVLKTLAKLFLIAFAFSIILLLIDPTKDKTFYALGMIITMLIMFIAIFYFFWVYLFKPMILGFQEHPDEMNAAWVKRYNQGKWGRMQGHVRRQYFKKRK